ncbi:MAG: nucleotidyltransferase family protein [Chloroflexi bacterium]|nr:nucleotidyltransferase family protein [Chloroflexota bacterium]
MAQREGVGPLLYWRFSRSGRFPTLPEGVRFALRSLYAASWAANHRLFQELGNILVPFRELGIPAVLLKGGCHALTIYPDPGLRPMSDLDLLVPKSRFLEAVQIVRSLGYVDSEPESLPGIRALLNHEACLVKDTVVVEIHHSLVADKSFTYAVPVDWFWEQTEPLPSLDTRLHGLHMLTPSAQLLYAAAHAMLQHGGHKVPLRWEYDIDQLVRSYADRLDWRLLLSQARAFAWTSALREALSSARENFDTPIPRDVENQLVQTTDRHARLVAEKQIRPATHIHRERLKWLSLNWMGRLQMLAALVFPSPAYMRWRYGFQGHWRLPWYYLVRWGGILKDGLRMAASTVWGGTSLKR